MGRKRNAKTKTINSDVAFETDLLACNHSPTLGRYLAAKSDIKKGSIILKEHCLVAGPKFSSGAFCIGCHAELSKSTTAPRFQCTKCNWLLCNRKCEKSPHHALECEFLAKKNIRPPGNLRSAEFGAISVLRALLLKEHKLKQWQTFASLEHHNEKRQASSVWEEDLYVIKVIREYWKLTEFSEEEIHMVCGIYEVNGFEMGELSNFGGIFPTAAMIAHDCIPNAGHFENMEDGSLEIVSVQDIPTGTPITMCYDSCLKSTTVRRKQLWSSKYFHCNCNRCLDPTELGTHFGSLICTHFSCKNGVFLCNSEDGVRTWICNKCQKTLSFAEVDELLKRYQDIIDNRLHTILMREEFLGKCKTIFHSNHFIPFSVKFNLCMAYGHDDGYTLFDLSSSQAHRKLELCQDVLKVLNVLTPGYSTARGNILYELQAAEVLIARNLLEGGKCSRALIKRKLQNSLKTLNEAISIFELCYPMRMLADSAKQTTLVELQDFIRSL